MSTFDAQGNKHAAAGKPGGGQFETQARDETSASLVAPDDIPRDAETFARELIESWEDFDGDDVDDFFREWSPRLDAFRRQPSELVVRAKQLGDEFTAAFGELRAAGLRHDADHPIAARYREASDAVNHARRQAEAEAIRAL